MTATIPSLNVVRTQRSKPVVSKPETRLARAGLLAVLLRALAGFSA